MRYAAAGNEVAQCEDLEINALEIAKGLGEESRTKTNPSAAQASQQQAPTDPPEAALTISGLPSLTRSAAR
jgi:hypothetical protein